MKNIKINEPISGLYADSDVKRAFNHLLDEVENFVPADRSFGNLSLKGAGSLAVAKAKSIENAAKTLVDVIRAVTIGYK